MTIDEMMFKLRTLYLPALNKQLDDYQLPARSVVVSYVKHLDQTDGIMFDMAVAFDEVLYMDDLQKVVEALDYYCSAEDYGSATIGGYRFLLGDGDDNMAVRLEDGKFKIWLRGWKE